MCNNRETMECILIDFDFRVIHQQFIYFIVIPPPFFFNGAEYAPPQNRLE